MRVLYVTQLSDLHLEALPLTIKDLAAQTGYSVGTISRALNNQPNVSPKARAAILRAAAECGFQLNTNAKQLKQQHSNAILVIVKGTSHELFNSLLETIQARMAETECPLIVDHMVERGNEVRRAVQLCLEKKPLGILFLGGNRENFLADFDKIRCPAVLVTNDATGLPFANLSSVSLDNVGAARMAVEHLIDLGHRKFAVVGGIRVHSDTTELRYKGCLEAFAAHNISFDDDLDYCPSYFSFGDGYRATKKLLEKKRDFTALFAMSDVIAIGAIRALRDAGLRVPEDISVVGFDGLTMGEYTVPKLTTVCQPIEEMAQRSITLLQENIASPREPRYEQVAVTLRDRESAKKI